MRFFRGCPEPGDRAIDPRTLQPIESCEHSDRYYTNGIKVTVSWRYGGRVGLPDFLRLSRRGYLWQRGFSFGQNLYTPDNIVTTEFQPNDRPYGAWLYVGFQGKAINTTNQHLIEVQVGCTGKCSRGRDVQTFIHRNFGAPTPGGWDYQIEDGLGWLFMYERQKKSVRVESLFPDVENAPGLDVSLRGRGMAGNVFTSATAGATVRLGWGLQQEFDPGDGPGTYPAMPGTSTAVPRRYTSEELAEAIKNQRSQATLYFFGQALGTAVRHNVFVTAAPSRVTLEPLVRTLEWGVAGSLRLPLGFLVPGRSTRIQLVWRNVWRSREFDQQPRRHQFGSFHFLVG